LKGTEIVTLGGKLVRWMPVAILAASLGGLVAAGIGQYGFGLQPCILCLYERFPYAVAAVLALVAVLLPAASRGQVILPAVCGCVFLAGAGLALFHVGVEERWWSPPPGCSGAAPTELTVTELRARLAELPPRPCNEPDFRLFGVTLAGYNGIVSLALATTCIAGAWMVRRVRGQGRDR
jgi:disulfide bond formation protein DsbB